MSDTVLPPIAAEEPGAIPLHKLGWKAFQDLCVAVSEEFLGRPVQSFLPVNDAGRDGGFVGRWDEPGPSAGESTIQCKFTSKPDKNLTLSMLKDELAKAEKLAARGLASDYIILTNHPVTGHMELQIRDAFESVGVGRCRVFDGPWIETRIRTSPKLRMFAPRLYGLGDLSDLLDARAYGQAKLILSAMGDDLEKLVVTDAHRRSVRAINEHNFVLLLGAPAAGKSTIGASLAIGAADHWQCGTIRATSPEDIQRHLDPKVPQFFWIDDAWGNTQYQRQSAERWNQIFPLMQGAMRKGTRFLITSRDYIWKAAQKDLKTQSIPVMIRSQVVINVEKLSKQERAQILYNHLKLGDQPKTFKATVKPHLRHLVERSDFLPEIARRLGSKFFTGRMPLTRPKLEEFFANPEDFLLETITNLASDCRAAIALVFLNGGKVRSPVAMESLSAAATAFGATEADVRAQLEALNGSLLLLVQDEEGRYWTYKHPTVSDAFARYVGASPEMVEIYLRGAKVESILSEVVTSGVTMWSFGDPVTVPDSLHGLLASRLMTAESYRVASFLTNRANPAFTALMMSMRPALYDRLSSYATPLKDDLDARLAVHLHSHGLLSDRQREKLVEAIFDAAIEEADASFIEDQNIGDVLTDEERAELLTRVKYEVLPRVSEYVAKRRSEWSGSYDPSDYFDELSSNIDSLVKAVGDEIDPVPVMTNLRMEIGFAVQRLADDYDPPEEAPSAPTAASNVEAAPIDNLFRDVDE
ncbi:MAG: hypothetical protein WA840_05370 [Caulobacteraceae bacterium]